MRGTVLVLSLLSALTLSRSAPQPLTSALSPAATQQLSEIRKTWAAGQLHFGDRRRGSGAQGPSAPDSQLPDGVQGPRGPAQGPRGPDTNGDDSSRDGRIHIGTHEFYRDKRGVRKIDEVLSHYIQGICTNFKSETREDCQGRGHHWFKCPEDFPHADSKVRTGEAHIPVCYTDRRYAVKGFGPPGSWCVPSHLISYGPEIADQIRKGWGQVCDRKEMNKVAQEKKDVSDWRHKAQRYKRELAKDDPEVSKLKHEVKREKSKEKNWKALAKAYRKQVEVDRDSAQVAVDQLQDALNDMNSGSSKPKTAHSAVIRTSNQPSTRDSRTYGKPLGRFAGSVRCEAPWKNSATMPDCQGTPCSAGACRYVKSNCRQKGGLFNYLILPYCSMGLFPSLGVLVLIVWLAILFLWLALAAENFLAPSLTTLSRLLQLSDSIAGVTLLALGNGAGDIASMVAASVASPHGSAMALGEALGSSLFVALVILGIITVSTPFFEFPPDFMRNVAFFLISVLWLTLVLWDNQISWGESFGFVLLYISFIYIVVNNHFARGAVGGAQGQRPSKHVMPLAPIPEDNMNKVEGSELSLLDYFNPLRNGALDKPRTMDRLAVGLRAPAHLIMKVTCPFVEEQEYNKKALMIQLFFAPAVLVWCVLLHGFPNFSPAGTHIAFASALIVGGLAAALVHVGVRERNPPDVVKLVSVVGFATSLAWIYALAVEAVHVLQALGRVMGLSDGFLGLTILSSANSIGDLFTNTAVARAGMAGMAASACVGAPLLNVLFGVGLSTLLGNLLVASPYPVDLNLELYVSVIFLLLGLVAMLLYFKVVPLSPQAAKNFGAMLILLYSVFLIIILGLEAVGGSQLLTTRIKDLRSDLKKN